MKKETEMLVAGYDGKVDEIKDTSERLVRSMELMKKFLNSYSSESTAKFNQEELQNAQNSRVGLEKLIATEGKYVFLPIIQVKKRDKKVIIILKAKLTVSSRASLQYMLVRTSTHCFHIN